mgnify:CR=1 FL=1
MRIVQSRNREYPRIYERNEQRLAKDHHRLRPGGGPPGNRTSVARIKALRQTIDNIDSAVIALLAERFKATSQVGVLKANAGFAPEDTKREDYQIERLHRIAIDAGLDPEIAEMYREFVVTEAKKRHQRIADAGGDPGVLDVFA